MDRELRGNRFKKICFLDDFLRSEVNQLVHHAPNLRAMAALFGAAADRLDVPTSRFSPVTGGGNLEAAAHMDALSLLHTREGWARACDADLTPWAAFSPLAGITPDELVIGWGLSAAVLRFLDQRGIAFIDLEIAPIRFCQHLKLWSRTNDKVILSALQDWAIDPEEPWLKAAVMRGSAARQGVSSFGAPGTSVGLYAGQTDTDIALIENGRIRRVREMTDDIAALARTVDVFAIKPHPYADDVKDLRELADAIPNAVWTTQNLYALFCAENIGFVSALSSGALQEAGYFGKPTFALIAPDRSTPHKLPPTCSPWLTVSPAVASLDWLERILSADVVQPAAEPVNLPRRQIAVDALDRIFRVRWALDDSSLDLFAVEVGRPYVFKAGAPILGCLAYGWAQPEEWGVWASGPDARVSLAFHRLPRSGRIRIELNGKLIAAGQADAPRVTVRMLTPGGATQATVVQPDGHCAMKVDLQSIHDAGGFLSLEFLIEHPVGSRSPGLNGDSPLPGYGLMGLSVSLD